MDTRFRTLLLTLTILSAPAPLWAQAQLTGTITDPSGQPIQFVEVTAVLGSLEVSAVSDADGTYLMTILDEVIGDQGSAVSVTARSLGYRTNESEVLVERAQTIRLDLVLRLDPLELDEIVVTGQGIEAPRVTIGTSITTVRSEDIIASQESNPITALSGKAPNVEVTSSAGDPGVGTYIRVRGAQTFTGSSQPMIVVDGTPISNHSDFDRENPADPGYAYALSGALPNNRAADISTQDIESIEILRGAAATSSYGSRGASGVVLITTKSGRPNTTRATFTSSVSVDKVTQLPQLQTKYGQGLDLSVFGMDGVSDSPVSWGPQLDSSTPVYDHAGELFRTGYRTDNSLSLSGGTDRTTYYVSLSHLKHEGTIRGASNYGRITARLNGSHELRENLSVRAHLAYAKSDASLVNHGSDRDGMFLGGLRTPPEYNNWPYRDPTTGLHRSYRCTPACLAEATASRGFDNPFWVSYEVDNDSKVDRTYGGVTTDFSPTGWLDIRHILGMDFSNDRRSSLWPQSSSHHPEGRLLITDLVRREVDHTLFARARRSLAPELGLELTLGQNINQATFEKVATDGLGLAEDAQRLSFVSETTAGHWESTVRTVGYFGRVSATLFDQLYVNGGLRYDGSDTFGGDVDPETGNREPSRYWYPEFSASWDFGRHLDRLGTGRLRLARGESGTQPPPYSNVRGFEPADPFKGRAAVRSQFILADPDIKPERTREWEVGADLAVWDDRVSMGITRYWQKTTDAILSIGTAAETGYTLKYENGASWRNWGWEITLDVQPITGETLTWTLGANWGQNKSMVDDILGAEDYPMGGISNASSALKKGHPFGVLLGTDFVRFGRGSRVNGVDIDAAHAAEPGTLYIGADGFPVPDPQTRPIGDPNPDWTGSLRSLIDLWGKVRLSALLDIKKGGDIWNGTKGALVYYGTHKDTDRIHGAGMDTVFVGEGPGAGEEVTLDWWTWGTWLGSGFDGPASQFVEDAGYVKLREITLSFSLQPGWLTGMGLESLDVLVSGRNLVTWTDYSGIDPETNLTGQSTARGLDYFNHPQTRSVVLGLTLRR